MIDIIHIMCGHIAFRYDHQPSPNEIHDPAHAVLLDGTRPFINEPIVCGSCGQQAEIADLRPADRPSWS